MEGLLFFARILLQLCVIFDKYFKIMSQALQARGRNSNDDLAGELERCFASEWEAKRQHALAGKKVQHRGE